MWNIFKICVPQLLKLVRFSFYLKKMKKVSDISVSWCISKPYFVLLYACDLSYFDVVFTGVGTGPADPAAGGPIIWQTRIFMFTFNQLAWTWNEKPQVEKCIHCGQFILGKISKFDATRCQVLKLKCSKFGFRCGAPPQTPLRGVTLLPQTP